MPSFFSPAKINLFLHVKNKRADGYHELISFFQAIDLYDEITIEGAKKDSFSCSDSALPMDEKNLVIKALRLFRQKTAIDSPLSIHLEKKIPQQAGLGGGSGNASTVLWALNGLYSTGISAETLSAWAAELGSDTSFFFSLGTALCSGRGEIVRNQPLLPQRQVTIVKPKKGLSTPAVFKALQLTEKKVDIESVLEDFYKDNFFCFNDLEKPAVTLMPELSFLKESLINCSAPHICLCGSGSSFFSLASLKQLKLTADYEIYHASFCRREENGWYGYTAGR